MIHGEPVRYYRADSSPAVVFLRGLGGAGVVWYRNLPALAEHYDVIASDRGALGAIRGRR